MYWTGSRRERAPNHMPKILKLGFRQEPVVLQVEIEALAFQNMGEKQLRIEPCIFHPLTFQILGRLVQYLHERLH